MPAVAGIAVVIAALMALLVIYGGAYLGKMVAQFLPGRSVAIPVSLRGIAESAINGVLKTVDIVFGVFIRPMIGFIGRPVVAALGWILHAEDWIANATYELYWIVTHGIPEALSAAKAYANGKFKAAENYALAKFHAAESYAAGLVKSARAYALSLYHAAETYAHNLYVAAEKYAVAKVAALAATVAKDYTAAKTYSANLVKAARADLGKSIAALEAKVATLAGVTPAFIAAQVAAGVKIADSYTDKAAGAILSTIDLEAIKGLAHEWDDIGDAIAAVEGVIATDLPDIGAAIRAIPRALPTDLTGALTIVGAISIPMLRYMEKCGIPNCRNLSKIGRDLQDLFGAVEGAAFLGLIAYMVGNPGGAAREADDVLTPLAGGFVHAARDLIGV